MQTKALELRDKGTFVPLLAVDMNPTDPADRSLARSERRRCRRR